MGESFVVQNAGDAVIEFSNYSSFNNIAIIPVTKGSKYKFTEASEQTANENVTLVYIQPVSGYVKYKKGLMGGS